MTISLIHPSRGRAIKSVLNTQKWINQAGVPIEVIVAIDNDDKEVPLYAQQYRNMRGAPVAVIKDNHTSVVHATNMAAAQSKGDILIYLSDDFDCFPDWGIAVELEFQKYKGPTLIKVDDCLQPFDVRVLTIPIMNRELYNKLGYFFHPAYASMFCDEHLWWRTRHLGALRFAPHLKFEHRHVSVGKAPNDETYKRSAANWDQGKAMFAKHKAMGFTV